VVTGPVLEAGLSTIGYNGVSVPNYYYKVLLDYDSKTGSYEAIGFLLPNRKGTDDLDDYVVSVDRIEQLTGIDFYSQLSDEIENDIEAGYEKDYWNWDASSVNTYGSSKSTAVRCQGQTLKGLRCKNRTKNESGFCYHHEDQADGVVKAEPTKRSQSRRCSASTADGTRCKRKTKSANGRCWQHGG